MALRSGELGPELEKKMTFSSLQASFDEVLESAMREGCIGQLPEIYDGENPCSSKGCFAQAWSVGELLRVYEVIEKKKAVGTGRK